VTDFSNDIPSPFSPLIQGAIITYELYAAYVSAGFTEAQAIQLVIGILNPNPPAGS